MNFEKFFRLVSYAAVFCGFLSLWVSGTFGIVGTSLFVAVMIAAWLLEGSRWQISERVGTALIVLALPVFYLAWRYQVIPPSGGETWIAGLLARMILSLTAIKLLQKKSARDWIFLYLMSFFEVLLAAGLSISALYLASFLVYLLVMVCAVIAFEIRKTSRAVELKIAGVEKKERDPSSEFNTALPVRRIPATAVVLIVFIVALAIPLFFMLPRVGGAGFGGNQSGLSTSTGFTESVKLGSFGRINQSDEVVMRVRFEGGPPTDEGLYFRGTALDTFDNQTWSKSKIVSKENFPKADHEWTQIDNAASREKFLIQTIYLEPLDTPVLFALPRAVAVQGGFPVIFKDPYGTISFQRSFERVSYKVLSDRSTPSATQLRGDDRPYTTDVQSYRDLPPVYDLKIAELGIQITAGARNRYDKARAVESYLQNNFGYTLDQKAGGREPLSDFLFNVREGHCEYFATAMAVILRTQGIATRVVNGFHGGEYNDAADVTVVRARNAHAWVEVYFPKENAWMTFDPTPAVGQLSGKSSAGIAGTVNKYIEALETFWIQYFVAFDNQEQRSLVRSMRNGVVDYHSRFASYFDYAQAIVVEWWAEVRGDQGIRASMAAIGYAIASAAGVAVSIMLAIWTVRKAKRLSMWRRLWGSFFKHRQSSIVEFYYRMQQLLQQRGLIRETHQTPLEFALEIGIPEAVNITKRYNRVRFGEKPLSDDEASEIETWLESLEKTD
jgi:transglutaminase-like putative cysteine protease